MTTKNETAIQTPEKFSYASSVAGDVWHPSKPPEGYEWWYFDALSDDGKDALVVIFLDNFIFSPRYNAACRRLWKKARKREGENEKSATGADRKLQTADDLTVPPSAFRLPPSSVPALAFTYYRDGKPLYRAINEFPAADFRAHAEKPACNLGENSFRFESAPYGAGYALTVKAILRGNRRLEAKLEWLSIESDLLPDAPFGDLNGSGGHGWNLVAARSDVTGSIKVWDGKGKSLDVRHFRGTGYHDHNLDARWLPAAVRDWQWGRAHFADATAVYYRYRGLDASEPTTKLFLIKNGELRAFDASCEERKMRRSIFGVKYPREISLATEEGIRLEIKQAKPIDESFFYLRFLSEAELKYPSSPDKREAFAVTEHLAPKALKYRWLDWLVNMRIGRDGKGSFLP